MGNVFPQYKETKTRNLILELLQTEDELDSEAIREHLNSIQLLMTNDTQEEFQDRELGVSKMVFVELVQTFTEKKSLRQKYLFFKKVFPEHYGLRFDTTLQILVWEFLSRLEEILPVSSFVEVASNSDLDPKLEDFGSDPKDLRTLFQHPPKGSPKLEKNRFPFRSTVIMFSLASKETSLITDEVFSEETDGHYSQPPIARLQEDSSRLGSSSGHCDEPSVQVTLSDGDDAAYSCGYCDKRFGTNALLKRHVRIHTGEKPHRCPYCDKGFTQQSNMKIHLHVHRHDNTSKKR